MAQADCKRLCEKINTSFPLLSKDRVRALFKAASKRKFPDPGQRNIALLSAGARERKAVAQHVIHNLRRVSKSMEITDEVVEETIFESGRASCELPIIRLELMAAGTLSNEVLYGKGSNSGLRDQLSAYDT